MRLMLLGDEQTGKTSLIQALKREYAQLNQSQQQQRKVRVTELRILSDELGRFSDHRPRTIFRFSTFPIGYATRVLGRLSGPLLSARGTSADR